jgi:hypothetical protein
MNTSLLLSDSGIKYFSMSAAGKCSGFFKGYKIWYVQSAEVCKNPLLNFSVRKSVEFSSFRLFFPYVRPHRILLRVRTSRACARWMVLPLLEVPLFCLSVYSCMCFKPVVTFLFQFKASSFPPDFTIFPPIITCT